MFDDKAILAALRKFAEGVTAKMTTQGQNLLYYGDNLDVLRRYLKDEKVKGRPA